jgi:putative peptidoglycan lipid II flippase
MLRAIATVGGITMASRVLGFARDILIARLIGAGAEADAFFVAFRFPNLFRRMFAEGAFNAAFVPIAARELIERGRDEARRFAEEALAVLLAALLLLTIACQVAMPWLMLALAPGFAVEPAKYDMAVQFTQITFPYLLLMSLTALYGGVLNTVKRFAAAAAAPMLLNVVLILALAVAIPLTGQPGLTLAWAVAIAGVVQLLWLVMACRRAGIALRLPRPRLTPRVRRLLRLMGPGVLGAGAMQINLVIGTIIASLEPGAVSYLYYADRVYQLPLGVIGAAVGVVLLPELAHRIRSGREQAAVEGLNRAIELTLLVTLPAAVGLAVLPGPIVTVLFQRGAFGAAEAEATAAVLAAFAAGLPAFVLVKALTPAFYAREDTRTPFIYAIAGMAANTVGALALFPLMGFLGIPIATSAAAWLNLGLVARRLAELGHLAPDERLKRMTPRIVVASLAMGAALVLAKTALEPALAGGLALKVGALAALVLGGAALYLAVAVPLGAVAPGELGRFFRRGRAASP